MVHRSETRSVGCVGSLVPRISAKAISITTWYKNKGEKHVSERGCASPVATSSRMAEDNSARHAPFVVEIVNTLSNSVDTAPILNSEEAVKTPVQAVKTPTLTAEDAGEEMRRRYLARAPSKKSVKPSEAELGIRN
ncbi:hypothetical protein T484DRAFT_1889396 [Baffinella frigidus]|nr:hypothetical protein T484DRAFT_1889396 [Cryptophyta sp. CCMP2293]